MDKSKDMTLENVWQCAARVLPGVQNSLLATLGDVKEVDGVKVSDGAKYEVELWLISLVVKVYLNQGDAKKALEVSSRGIQL